MTTTRRRRQAPAPQPLAPVSPAALRLIEQVRAEAQAATLEELSAKDGIKVLHPIDPATRFLDAMSSYVRVADLAGAEEICWIYHDGGSQRVPRPVPYWLVSIQRVDGDGLVWRRSLGPHIVDDFGTLVPMREA